MIELDPHRGQLNVLLSIAELESRPLAQQTLHETTLGRNLFDVFRRNVSKSTSGASVFGATADAKVD